MTLTFIVEKTLAEFDDDFDCHWTPDTVKGTRDAIKAFLTTALEEAHSLGKVEGLELAEGAVPPDAVIASYRQEEVSFTAGWDECRAETLSRLAAVKKVLGKV